MHFCCSEHHPGQGWCGKCSLINWIMLLPKQHVSGKGCECNYGFCVLVQCATGSARKLKRCGKFNKWVKSDCVQDQELLCSVLPLRWSPGSWGGIGQPACRALSFPPWEMERIRSRRFYCDGKWFFLPSGDVIFIDSQQLHRMCDELCNNSLPIRIVIVTF